MRHILRMAELLAHCALTFALLCGTQVLGLPSARSAGAWQRAAHIDAAQSDASDSTPDEIEAAWDRAGCQLNPGNPTCILLGRAAACDSSDRDPACTNDSDRDGCLDISEALAGLDPLNADDCLGDAAGTPLLNCLFPRNNASCGVRSEAPKAVDCPLLSRDPLCDGFGP
jgi:hypothetical protein